MDRVESHDAGLGTVSFTPPRPLRPDDDIAAFDCGRDALNEWLVRRALRSERERDARTYVSCETNGGRVVGYYCLAASSVQRSTPSGALAQRSRSHSGGPVGQARGRPRIPGRTAGNVPAP